MAHLLPTIRGCSWHLLALPISLLVLSGCGDDDDPTGGNGTDNPVHVTIPLEGAASDITVVANQPTHVEMVLHVPPDLAVLDEVTIDVAGTLDHVELLTPVKSPFAQGLLALVQNQAIAEATIRVGIDPATVCDEGTLYGPYPAGVGFFASPTPASIELDAATVQVMNYGPVVLCIDFTSTMDATFSIDAVEADVVEGACSTPADFSGVWAGTYECGNSCGSPFSGDIEITIAQDGHSASYSDGGDPFTGTVCGNRFRFERIQDDEIERGTLTFYDSNTLIKRSQWRGRTAPYCTGSCYDVFTRVPGK